jgi:hypothetical protein
MAVRIKTRWHKPGFHRAGQGGRPKTMEDRASALSHNLWKIAFAMYKNMEKEEFKFSGGTQITDLLTEIAAFLIQVTDRIVYGQIEEEDRKRLITAVSKQLGATVAENLADLLGPGDYLGPFIETLNQRFHDYAECSYGDDGPGYAFLRYFGDRTAAAMAAGDNKWVVEHVMEIEAPQALKLIRRTVSQVLGVKAR